jgi:hypothetical protein
VVPVGVPRTLLKPQLVRGTAWIAPDLAGLAAERLAAAISHGDNATP